MGPVQPHWPPHPPGLPAPLYLPLTIARCLGGSRGGPPNSALPSPQGVPSGWASPSPVDQPYPTPTLTCLGSGCSPQQQGRWDQHLYVSRTDPLALHGRQWVLVTLLSSAAQEAPSPWEGEVPEQTQPAQPGPPDPRPLASAFQPQLPSKCLLCPPLHPRPQGPRPGVGDRPSWWKACHCPALRRASQVRRGPRRLLPTLGQAPPEACGASLPRVLPACLSQGASAPEWAWDAARVVSANQAAGRCRPLLLHRPGPGGSAPASVLWLSFARSANPGSWRVASGGVRLRLPPTENANLTTAGLPCSPR